MNELLRLLGNIAPGLATAVAGPLGGAAVSAIAKQFGVEDTVEAVTKAVAADPDAALKLAQIDLETLKVHHATPPTRGPCKLLRSISQTFFLNASPCT
jgi:hypothetical protein